MEPFNFNNKKCGLQIIYQPFGDGIGGRKIRVVNICDLVDRNFTHLPINLILEILNNWYVFQLTMLFGYRTYDVSNFFGKFSKDLSQKIYVLFRSFWMKSERQLKKLPARIIRNLSFRNFYHQETVSNEALYELSSIERLLGIHVENDMFFHTLSSGLEFLEFSIDNVNESVIRGLNNLTNLRHVKIHSFKTSEDFEQYIEVPKTAQDISKWDLDLPKLKSLYFHRVPKLFTFRVLTNLRCLHILSSKLSRTQIETIVMELTSLKELVIQKTVIDSKSSSLLVTYKRNVLVGSGSGINQHPFQCLVDKEQQENPQFFKKSIEKLALINCKFSMNDWENIQIYEFSDIKKIILHHEEVIPCGVIQELLRFRSLITLDLTKSPKVDTSFLIGMDKNVFKTELLLPERWDEERKQVQYY